MAKETFSSLIDLFKTSPSSSVLSLVCDVCGNKLSVFRKKKPCAECKRQFCSQCLQRCRDRALRCRNCSILTMRPPMRSALMELKVKDLRDYLSQHGVSTRGCLEKEDLVNVLLRYANNPGSSQFGNLSSHPRSSLSSSSYAHSHAHSGTSTHQPDTAAATVLSTTASSASNTTSVTIALTTGGNGASTSTTYQMSPSQSLPAGHGDSDSSSETSFEMVQRPSSDENFTSVHSSASSTSASAISSRGNLSVFPQSSTFVVEDTPLGRPDGAEVKQETSRPTAGKILQDSETSDSGSPGANGTSIENLTARMESMAISSESYSGGPLLSEPPSEPHPSIPNTVETPGGNTQFAEPQHSETTSTNNSPNLLRDIMSSISSEADFEELSVKQLKDILHRHRVNYRGCCEKAELIERAKRLYRDYCTSRADLEKLDLDALCKICMDAPVECVMLECGHMATCTDCGRQLSECPICRQFVVRIVRTFKA